MAFHPSKIAGTVPMEDVFVPSSLGGGLRIAVTVYGGIATKPAADGQTVATTPPPVIVMGHGIGAIKEAGLAPFATAFVQEGYTAVAFDYLCWGNSDGEPRGVMNVGAERRDFADVVEWVKGQPARFDRTRIVVWGSSFGGMHTTALLASDSTLAGGIAQCPCVDGFAAQNMVQIWRRLALMPYFVRDVLGILLGRKDAVYVAIANDESKATTALPSLLWGKAAVEGQKRITPPGKEMNRIAARSLLSLAVNRPVLQAEKITAPYLLVVATVDTEAPIPAAETCARLAKKGELLRVSGSHFDVYEGGRGFEENLVGQLVFLRKILLGAGTELRGRL